MANVIRDCSYGSLEQALGKRKIPQEILETLCLVNVPHLSFEYRMHEGQLVVHKALEEEVRFIFTQLVVVGFPIERVVPAIAYRWIDERSMSANNTSAFNIRKIPGTSRYSQHSYGWAIDPNPWQNPCHDYRFGTITPRGARYDPSVPGTITKDSPIVGIFKNCGWVWGGDWKSLFDPMHFEKRLDGGVS